ncbi:MAG: hypothetical protein AAF211_15120 [Myxococcota bacterium]
MSTRTRVASSLGVLTAVVPFVVPIVAMLFGMLIGGAIGWNARDDQGLGAVIERDPDAFEPILEAQKVRLTEIREVLAGLGSTVTEREGTVAELTRRLSDPDLSARALGGLETDLTEAREGLTEVRLEVRELQRTKDQLVDRLTATEAQLQTSASDVEAEAAIRDALQSEGSELVREAITLRWRRMITEAQLDVCDGFGRRRRESCRNAVVRGVKDVRREFVFCLRTNQTAPSVHHRTEGQRLPSHSRLLDDDDRFLENWYVQLCDPTLPEDTGPAASTGP